MRNKWGKQGERYQNGRNALNDKKGYGNDNERTD